jgi:hypothetical protein
MIVTIQLTNQKDICFEVEEGVDSKAFLGEIHPGKLFTQSSLRIHSDSSSFHFKPAYIDCIVFKTEEIPSWPPQPDMNSIQRLTKEEYAERLKRVGDAYGLTTLSGGVFKLDQRLVEINFSSGRSLFLEYEAVRSEMERRMASARIFERPVFQVTLKESGFILVNVNNIQAIKTTPDLEPNRLQSMAAVCKSDFNLM